MLADDVCAALPNDGPKLCSYCANEAKDEKGFCAGGASNSGALEED